MSIIPPRSLLRYSTATFILLICFFIFFNYNQSIPSSNLPTNSIPSAAINQPLEKLIVVASQQADDTTWLQRRLPSWPIARYIVDTPPPSYPYQVPLNKGREAMVYLTHIIENYHHLPSITVFIHSTQYQWHNDDPNHDGATVLSNLQLPYIIQEGYVNLRCVWILGCPEELHPNALMTNESQETEVIFKDAYTALFYGDAISDVLVPDAVGQSCCAQFAVSRDAVLRRPRSDYERFRRWLVETELDDAVSGRVFEYSWHMIFGKAPVFCPSAESCYCNVFGLCDLEGCGVGACEGRYEMPAYTDVPDDWVERPDEVVV